MGEQMLLGHHLHEATKNVPPTPPPAMSASGPPPQELLLFLTTDHRFLVKGRTMTLVFVLLFALFLSCLLMLYIRRVRRKTERGDSSHDQYFPSLDGQPEWRSTAAGESKRI
ncbi:hypothetical protein QJS10_CPB20g00260 [Acorus calamus]|uniref:Uncharacterized protein n=1 Tax=Acorus calamus TaxID=4465 RepID=A0AAV9CBN7_ACOCL|nr:hypothetical protein QJS10_CPB20g00260 [Acorus calamus]